MGGLRGQLWAGLLVAMACAFGRSEAAGQLGPRSAEEWIRLMERPERVATLRIDEIISRLRLGPGDVVADIGAGAGTFSLPFARAVAPGGTVYAVEIDPELVAHIEERAETEGVRNLAGVLGEFTDPALPARDVDLAFFHDVLHHVEDRAGYLESLAGYIGPEGRVVVIENPRPHEDPDRSEMHLSREEVDRWMADAGFGVSEEHDLFGGGKWFVVYSRR